MWKKHYFKVLSLCIFSFLTVFLLFRSLGQNPREKKSALVGKEAPNFRALVLSDGSKKEYRELKDYKGKGLVLSFWASWCSVCQGEGQYLNHKRAELDKQNSLQKIEFLRLAVSDSYENVFAFWKADKKKIPAAFDETGDIALDYGLTGVPETFFIDEKGAVVYRHRGPLSEELFEKYSSLIAKKS